MSFFLLFRTIFKWSIPVLLWVSHVCSETSIETNTGLSLPLSLYSQLGGSLSVTFGLSTFLFFSWTCGNLVLTGLSVSPQGRLCFFFFFSVPSSILVSFFPSFSVWFLCLSHVFSLSFLAFHPSVCVSACWLSVHLPMSVSCFPSLFVHAASCRSSLSWCKMTTNIKKEKCFPASLSISFLSVSQTGINTKASELWYRELCCGMLSILKLFHSECIFSYTDDDSEIDLVSVSYIYYLLVVLGHHSQRGNLQSSLLAPREWTFRGYKVPFITSACVWMDTSVYVCLCASVCARNWVKQTSRERGREKCDPEFAFMTQAHSPRLRSVHTLNANTHTHTCTLSETNGYWSRRWRLIEVPQWRFPPGLKLPSQTQSRG